MKHIKNKSKSAFTLIELLVVLAIIGILAGLLFPAVQSGMTAARQARDVSNLRNVALSLISDSFDTGIFRRGSTADHSSLDSTTLEVFQGMLDDELIDDPGIFHGFGAKKATTFTLSEENIGFQYVAGYTSTSNSRLPLLITKGTGLQKSTLIGDNIPVGTSAWSTKGVAVAYVGGNSTWIKATKDSNETLELIEPLGIAKTIPNVVVYK